MMHVEESKVRDAYHSFLEAKAFPCVAARAALQKNQVRCFVATHMACPHDDTRILEFLYDFIDEYRRSEKLFYSAAVIFKGPQLLTEEVFDGLLWQRLQALADLDAAQYSYDHRVSNDPASPDFAYSLKGEASFVIGLHPASSRPARQFAYPTLVFNPHAQFEALRASGGYEKMKDIVRKKDLAYSGSVNPMLTDFGAASDAYQYSGRVYGSDWQCPFKDNHGSAQHHPAA